MFGIERENSGRSGLHWPDRELSHDHLRVRPADLFAVARGLFSDVAFRDAPAPQNTGASAGRRLRTGAGGGSGDLSFGTERRGRSGAAEYGGLRRRDRIHFADGRPSFSCGANCRRSNGPTSARWGRQGRLVAAIIAGVTLVTLFLNPDYNRSVLGAASGSCWASRYFAVYARHRLILSPEEEFALNIRSHDSENASRQSQPGALRR